MSSSSSSASSANDLSPSSSINEEEEDDGKNVKGGKENGVVHTARFTVLQQEKPVSIVAQYGPFRASQTAPVWPTIHEGGGGAISPLKVEVSAHLVTKEVPKDKPVLRVLFHVSGVGRRSHRNRRRSVAGGGGGSGGGGGGRVCVRITAQASGGANASGDGGSGRRRTAYCSPGGSRRSGGGSGATCLGELALPSSWWPPLAGTVADNGEKEEEEDKKKRKDPKESGKQSKVAVSVSYSVFETRGGECDESQEEEGEGEKADIHAALVFVCLSLFSLDERQGKQKQWEKYCAWYL